LADILATADRLGLELLILDATTPTIDLDAALAHVAPNGADGLLVGPGNLFFGALRVPPVQLAARARLPGMYSSREL
jgi:hypothetical protein